MWDGSGSEKLSGILLKYLMSFSVSLSVLIWRRGSLEGTECRGKKKQQSVAPALVFQPPWPRSQANTAAQTANTNKLLYTTRTITPLILPFLVEDIKPIMILLL